MLSNYSHPEQTRRVLNDLSVLFVSQLWRGAGRRPLETPAGTPAPDTAALPSRDALGAVPPAEPANTPGSTRSSVAALEPQPVPPGPSEVPEEDDGACGALWLTDRRLEEARINVSKAFTRLQQIEEHSEHRDTLYTNLKRI